MGLDAESLEWVQDTWGIDVVERVARAPLIALATVETTYVQTARPWSEADLESIRRHAFNDTWPNEHVTVLRVEEFLKGTSTAWLASVERRISMCRLGPPFVIGRTYLVTIDTTVGDNPLYPGYLTGYHARSVGAADQEAGAYGIAELRKHLLARAQ